MKRVYHPTLPMWEDVPEKDVEQWKDAGWRVTKPAHVDDSDALPVGAFHVPSVPVDPVIEPAPQPVLQRAEKPSPAEKPAEK